MFSFITAVFISLIYFSDYSADRTASIQSFTKISKLPHIALSTSYLQQRIVYYNDYSNIFYPQMREENKLDYVYTQ
ncbi:MAG: hypothetical protein U9P38_03440 [Campylobacterota bacterium]|nr:hypothetical protein [Campylobacterota bacterium]